MESTAISVTMKSTAISASGENCEHKNIVILCHNVTVSHLYGSASRQMLLLTLAQRTWFLRMQEVPLSN